MESSGMKSTPCGRVTEKNVSLSIQAVSMTHKASIFNQISY